MVSKEKNTKRIKLEHKSSWGKIKFRLLSIFDNVTFRFKNSFFKSDLSVTIWTFIILYLGGIALYFLLILIGKKYPLFHAWSFETFIGVWTSFISLILTYVVLLKINLQKTQTGKDFIEILIGNLSLTSKNEKFTIITPNINIASYIYKHEFNRYLNAVNRALEKGVKIEFLSLGLDNEYLKKANEIILQNDSSSITKYFKEGSDNNSPMLSYLYSRYQDKMKQQDYYYTLKTISEISNQDNTTIINLKEAFTNENIVGFFNDRIFYIGKYGDKSAKDGEVVVAGETVTDIKAIEILKTHLVDGLKNKFEIT